MDKTIELAQSLPTTNPWIKGVKTVGVSLLLALGVRVVVAEPRYVPTGSMEPTIQANDRVLIDKITYRVANPKRGDIIVFAAPQALLNQNLRDDLIKRVIGLPGETVEVKQGWVYINRQPLAEDYIASPPEYHWGPDVVPANSYLVLGDNRNDSYDSHFWGYVPRDRIIGRAMLRFYPFQRLGLVGTEDREKTP